MNKDDKDILRQMRSVYGRSNRIFRMFSHCSIYGKLIYLPVINSLVLFLFVDSIQ